MNGTLVQKGMDMRKGLDIASMALKRQIAIVILASCDSEFVPQCVARASSSL
ncbi:MAG: hypothetical protein J4G15_04240 [Alphaproteobacteria bacterium]|nr:hypothetical protein [Alphaproteobacteria bacterium]